MIHLQIEIVGDFRPEFMSRACLTCFGTKLVGQKQSKFILLGRQLFFLLWTREDASRRKDWEGPIKAWGLVA